jgi:hypothetical protein
MSTSACDSDIFYSKIAGHIKKHVFKKENLLIFPCALGIDEENNIVVVR